MSRVVLVIALLTGLLLPAVPAQAETVTLGGVVVQLLPGTTQVLSVDRTSGYRAQATWWEYDGASWLPIATTHDARIGSRGLVPVNRRKQGSATTPLGTFRLLDAFGMGPSDSSYKINYRQVRPGDYWVQDNRSAFYNRYRNKAEGGFRWWLKRGRNTSENLIRYRYQYEWAINTSFNFDQVRRRGAGIFVHVNGRGATAGCVSLPRAMMQQVMRQIDPVKAPVVAIGS